MAKRYTDTEIWKKQRWFKRLSLEYKLVFFYIKDQCNHAGIYNIDVLSLCEDIGIDTFNLRDFINKCNQDFDKITGEPVERIRFKMLGNSSLWFTIFMRFQYEGKDFKINPAVAAVKSAIEILRGYMVLDEALDKGYITIKEDLDNPYLRVKDKDIDKDIDKENSIRLKKVEFQKMVEEASLKKPGSFTKEILNSFFSYWTEPTKNRTKLKWELQDTWDTARRLGTWRDKDDKFSRNDKKVEPTISHPFIIGQKHNAAG
jgi:hypothetical protein